MTTYWFGVPLRCLCDHVFPPGDHGLKVSKSVVPWRNADQCWPMVIFIWSVSKTLRCEAATMQCNIVQYAAQTCWAGYQKITTDTHPATCFQMKNWRTMKFYSALQCKLTDINGSWWISKSESWNPVNPSKLAHNAKWFLKSCSWGVSPSGCETGWKTRMGRLRPCLSRQFFGLRKNPPEQMARRAAKVVAMGQQVDH